jgi:hypothetical protein
MTSEKQSTSCVVFLIAALGCGGNVDPPSDSAEMEGESTTEAAANVGNCSTLPNLGYGSAPYGGAWASLHRDGRNSDFADCEVASTPYTLAWSATAASHIHFVKPVLGPKGRAWLAVSTFTSDGPYLYGVDMADGNLAVRLGRAAGLNSSINFGQPVIDSAGNIYLGQNLPP